VDPAVGQADGLVDQDADRHDRGALGELLCVAAEGVVEHLDGGLAGDLAGRRAAHAVGDDVEEERSVGDRELPHAVVVLVEGAHAPHVRTMSHQMHRPHERSVPCRPAGASVSFAGA
jgi:hypothetical protein